MDAQYQTTVQQATDGQSARLTITADRRLRVDGGGGTAGSPSGGVQSVQEVGALLTAAGAVADAAWASGSGSIVALLKAIAGAAISTNPVQSYTSDSYQNVAAGTATTVVKSGAGTLVSITINTKGASSNTLTVYDNTAASGTKIATIDTTGASTTLFFGNGVAFATGLTCASATGTGADYTVAYR